MACFGAVNLSTGRLVTWFCPLFNGETFEAFVRRLLRHRRASRRMVLVLATVQPAALGHRARLEVWKLTRRLATHNRRFPTLPAVLEAVTACFRRWGKPNETLRRLCCIT